MAGHLKRFFSAFLAFVFVGGVSQGLSLSAASQYADEISIYSVRSGLADRANISDPYKTEFQINPADYGLSGSGTATYTILTKSEANFSGSGYNTSAINVSDTGLVTAGYYNVYWMPDGWGWPYPKEGYIEVTTKPSTGSAVVRVTLGSSYRDILINHYDYTKVYPQIKTEEFIAENAKPNMSVYEIADLGAKFAASFKYDYDASTAEDMITANGGDCWGSTSIVVMICERYGVKAWPRNGRKDELAGSLHRNALVEDTEKGVWYEVEAGYSSFDPPRYYKITTRTSLFSYRALSGNNIEVYSYDIDPALQKDLKSITFPSKIDGKTVTSIGYYFLDPIFNEEKINSVYIPKTITNIAQYAFGDCDTLTDIYYEGTEAEWNAITIGNGNEIVQNATVHCSTVSLPKPAQVKLTSLALNDRIGLRFKLELPDEFLNDSGAYAEVNGTRCQIESQDENKMYPVMYNVAVPDLDSDLVIKLYRGDGSLYPLLDKSGNDVTSSGFKYSVKQYIKDATTPGSGVSENTIVVVKRLNDFGKKSKAYFGKTDNIGSYSNLAGDIDSVKLSDLSRYAFSTTTASNAGISRTETSLALEAATEINHKFSLDSGKSINDYKFYVNGTLVTTSSSGNYRLWYNSSNNLYTLTIKGIAPSHLQDVYQVIVTDNSGKEMLRISNFSALSYAHAVLAKADNDSAYAASKAKLISLIKAMYLYNRAAMIRFKVTEPEIVTTTGTNAVNTSVEQKNSSVDMIPADSDSSSEPNDGSLPDETTADNSEETASDSNEPAESDVNTDGYDQNKSEESVTDMGAEASSDAKEVA